MKFPEAVQDAAQVLNDYKECLNVLEWLRTNNLLTTDESDDSLAHSYAIHFASDTAKACFEQLKEFNEAREAERLARESKPRRKSDNPRARKS